MTSLLSSVLAGVQRPRLALVPASVGNESGDAAFLAAAYGLTPDEWQRSVLEAWMGVRADGRWAAPRAGLAVPRQNGKNAALEIRELFGMVQLGERFLHTAHEVKTARKAFARLAGFFDNPRQFPELAGLVAEVRRTNGQEAIVLSNGGSVEFAARSKSSGRGFSVDVLVLDEAQELSEDAYAALLPTISASPNPQQLMTGTPPAPVAVGEVFTRFRGDGVAGEDPRLAWVEWSCPDTVDLDDELEWAAANPALGIRLDVDQLRVERSSMSDDTFARERLGVWGTQTTRQVIDAAAWEAIRDPGSEPVDPVVFALDTTPDRARSSIGLAALRADGVPHVELVANDRGSSWVVDTVLQLVGRWKPLCVVVDASGPAGAFIPALLDAGVELLTTGAREMGQACGGFVDAVSSGQLRQHGEPALAVAAAAVRKRAIGDAFGWARKDSTDISPLVAVTLALWGLSTRQQREPRKQPSKVYAF